MKTPHGGDLRTFGRRRGRKLSPRQERLITELLPRVRVALTDSGGVTAADQAPAGSPIESSRRQGTWLEIGFGGGEHLVWQAEHNPATTLIGCEPFQEGVVKALAAIKDKGLSNILIHPDDARPLLRSLAPSSISRAFILFPDPWPKKRHAKRRLVSVETLTLLAAALRPGAQLRIATDIGDYARLVLAAAQAAPAFRWIAKSPCDWRVRPADWPQTRYESKALREGRRCYFFTFERV